MNLNTYTHKRYNAKALNINTKHDNKLTAMNTKMQPAKDDQES